MKKSLIIIVSLLIFSSFNTINFISEEAIAIEQHDEDDGNVRGIIQCSTTSPSNVLTVFPESPGFYNESYHKDGSPGDDLSWQELDELGNTGDENGSYLFSNDTTYKYNMFNVTNATYDMGEITKVRLSRSDSIYGDAQYGQYVRVIRYDGVNHWDDVFEYIEFHIPDWSYASTTWNNPKVLWDIYNMTKFNDMQIGFKLRIHPDYWIEGSDARITNLYMNVTYYTGFNVTRDVSPEAETNYFNYTTQRSHSGNVTLKIPVSSNTKGIVSVHNYTDNEDAVEVNTSDELVNNTYWYDVANQYVHIRTTNLSIGSTTNWSVNCSYGASFNLIIPSYLEVGQYFHSEGFISNSSGYAIENMIAETRLLYSNGTDALDVNPKHNCTGGNYQCSFSTATLVPGTYGVSIEFTDPTSGIVFKEGGTLYLSVDPGEDIHISTFLHFTFYNNNTGIGIPSESFKVYASDDSTVDSSDRIYADLYGVYTGQTIYYRIDDFFDNQVYPTSGDYVVLNITSINQFEDIPIDWYSFSVKNMNHSIVRFSMVNASRNYTRYLFPYEPFYWNVLRGEYNITLNFYNPVSGAYIETTQENISITDDSYYWIEGYDLRDIIIEVTLVNSTINSIEINITTDITAMNSTIGGVNTSIRTTLTVIESNISAINYNVWNAINVTDSIVDWINTTIWTNFSNINITGNVSVNWTSMHEIIGWLNENVTFFNVSIGNLINVTIDNMSNVVIEFWSGLNTTLVNRSVVVINFYNTNDGLGLQHELLKIYINGTRYKDTTYYVSNGTIINLTVRDYYNQTLYWGNHTISAPFTFLDLGLTFHSYKFCNMNEEYYIVSFLKSNATRWYEKGICPYETMEFVLPSGYNYTMRVYNSSYTGTGTNGLITNQTVNIISSKVFLINGSNLSVIISGLSEIEGMLLELQVELAYATQADIVYVSYNVPYVYSLFDMDGQIIGGNIIKICPAQTMIATSYNNTWGNNTISPLMPANTTANGTIMFHGTDRFWFHGGASTYVNITFANGTFIQNTTYIPVFYDADSHVIIINSSHNLTISRETRWQQVKKFDWTKYTDTGLYMATVNFTNPLNTVLENPYFIIEFANDTTPDYNTVEVYDVTNGVWLREGEHFDASATGVHLAVTSMLALGERLFTVQYYAREEAILPSDGIVVLSSYGDMKEHLGRNYNYLRAQWINTGSDTFIGSIDIQFNFSTYPYIIASETIDIYDEENMEFLNRNEFSYTGSGITITQETVGSVYPQGTRTFEIYYLYLEEEEPVEELTEEIVGFLRSPIIENIPYIGDILGVHIICIVLLAIGVGAVISGETYKKNLWVLAIMLLFVFLVAMAYFQPYG